MSSLTEKILKQTRSKSASILSESDVFDEAPPTVTEVPILNIALSGKLNGGLRKGTTIFAGKTKSFKTSISLHIAAAFLKQHKDGVILFYDSEFGSPMEYFKQFDVDTDRVIHNPVLNIEDLKFDIMKQLNNLEKKDKVLILIDSIGNVPSKKEVDDALNENQAADMTRAKQLKSLFRMITPELNMKDIPLIAINHTYDTQDFISKEICSGGTGPNYSSNDIFIISRRQEKEGTDVKGYYFTLKADKSRSIKEQSKLPLFVSWEKGIEKYSGLFDLALFFEYIKQEKKGWYVLWDFDDKQYHEKNIRAKDIDDAFFQKLINDEYFNNLIKQKFQINPND